VQIGQPGGPAQPVEEKTLSYVRKEFRATAESRKRPPLIAVDPAAKGVDLQDDRVSPFAGSLVDHALNKWRDAQVNHSFNRREVDYGGCSLTGQWCSRSSDAEKS
jgi:hypothetical protein